MDFEHETPETEIAFPEELQPEEVQAEIRRTRHRKELRLYRLLIALGVLAIFYVFWRAGERPSLEELQSYGYGDPTTITMLSTIALIASLFTGIGGIVIFLISLLFQYYAYYGGQLAYSIRVSEKNFPEIYHKAQEYTRLLGLKKMPEIYVRQMNGQVNAYTSWVPGKTFIQLNAEIVDLAYMENKDFDTVFFVMAHEFGHVHLHHVQLAYTLWPMLAMFFPAVGQLFYLGLQRAREYSADRVAQALTAGKAELETMMMLSAGRHAYKYVDAEDYVERINENNRALERFARWCINFGSTHPIHPYRVRAILDPEKRSGRLL